jgi:hypothetical protein
MMESVARPSMRVEKRSERRFKVTCRRADHPEIRVALTENVSRHGLFLVTSTLEEVGTPLEIEVALPSGKAKLKGVVAWCRATAPSHDGKLCKLGLGVRLTGVPRQWELLFI